MRHWLAIVPAVLIVCGCPAFYRVAPNEPIPEHATVAITFEEPRDLEARRDATVYALPAVTKVYGELESTRTDTLVLRGLEIESSQRQPELPAEARLIIVPGASAEVSTVRISKGRTAVAVTLAAVGLFFLWVANMEW